MPHPLREESVNLGVVLIARDGTYADVAFTDAGRARAIDPHADIHSIELFLEGIRDQLPSHGHQLSLSVPGAPVSVERLTEWHREFGGQVRITEPRIVMGDDPKALLNELYGELVAPLRRERQSRQKVIGRSDILRVVDETLSRWNLSRGIVESHARIHGRRAEHVVDRVFRGADGQRVTAILEAISFQSIDIGDLYATRAALIVAAEDLRQSDRGRDLAAFAAYADAPANRGTLVEESAELFRAKQIVPIRYRDLAALRRTVDAQIV
jgi:hypothetical protein